MSISVARGRGSGARSGAADRPLTARSVALSLLLGSHPDRMSPAALIRAGEHFGVPASTMRVALTRAVAAGELRRTPAAGASAGGSAAAVGPGAPDDYALGDRLLARQRRQDEAVEDAETAWDGDWEMAVVVVSGRPGADRAALRDLLQRHRLAELREGVWTRPANLRRPAAYADDPVLACFTARLAGEPGGPDAVGRDSVGLAASLWDLDGWAREGRGLLHDLGTTADPARRLAVAARLVRHLTQDPLLPPPLRPAGWPGEELRRAYADYQAELRVLTAG